MDEREAGGFALRILLFYFPLSLLLHALPLEHLYSLLLSSLFSLPASPPTVLSSPPVTIIPPCTAREEWAFFLASVLAHPSPVRKRVKGLFLSLLIPLLNLLRLILFFPLLSSPLLPLLHDLLFRSFILLSLPLLFLLFLRLPP